MAKGKTATAKIKEHAAATLRIAFQIYESSEHGKRYRELPKTAILIDLPNKESAAGLVDCVRQYLLKPGTL
jgi:hypothetical protein